MKKRVLAHLTKFRHSACFAVAAGFVADMLTTQVLVILMGGMMAAKTIHVDWQKAPPGQLESLIDRLMQTMPFLVTATALELLACVVGGYVAAAFSEKGKQLHNAFFSGALILCVAATAFLDPGGAPRWLLILGFALSLPATLGGALLQIGARHEADSHEKRDET